MPRSDSDAVAARPTIAEEMSKFQGFSTENGETLTKDKPEDLNPVAGKNMTAAEIEAAKAGDKVADKTAAKTADAKPAKLTDEESDAVIAALDKTLGREATEDEITAALTAESAKKGGVATPKPKTVQDRINKAVRAQRTAERKVATAERERDEARAALAAGAKAPLTDDKTAVKDDADVPPDPKKFEYGELDANYIRALARFETRQEIAASKKTEQTATLTAKETADKAKFEAAKAVFEDKGSELFEDFEEVVMQGARDKAWPLSDTLGAVLMVSEYGPQIAYELASDPKEAKRINDMPTMRQVAWLGRREAELESAGSGANGADKVKAAAETKVAATVSKAPAPVQRVRGQGSASTVPGDTQDFAAFEAAAMGRKTR